MGKLEICVGLVVSILILLPRRISIWSLLTCSTICTRSWGESRGLQRNVVYLGWSIAPKYFSPNEGARGSCGLAGSQPMSTAVHRSPIYSLSKLREGVSTCCCTMFSSCLFSKLRMGVSTCCCTMLSSCLFSKLRVGVSTCCCTLLSSCLFSEQRMGVSTCCCTLLSSCLFCKLRVGVSTCCCVLCSPAVYSLNWGWESLPAAVLCSPAVYSLNWG